MKTLGWSVPDRTVRAKAYSDSMWLREQRRPVWLSEVGMGGEASRRRRQGPDPGLWVSTQATEAFETVVRYVSAG